MSAVSRRNPWYYFRLYTDLACMIPQGYILTKKKENIDNLSVSLFSMWMMLHTLNAIYLTVGPKNESWAEPNVISRWTGVFVGSIPIIRFFLARQRSPSSICGSVCQVV